MKITDSKIFRPIWSTSGFIGFSSVKPEVVFRDIWFFICSLESRLLPFFWAYLWWFSSTSGFPPVFRRQNRKLTLYGSETSRKPGKVGYSASIEGSTIAVGQLPVFTENESSDRESEIIPRKLVKNYIGPESVRSLDQFIKNKPQPALTLNIDKNLSERQNSLLVRIWLIDF